MASRFPRHWVDGVEQGTIPLDDRGLSYADGVFETFMCVSGNVSCLSFHLERLCEGLTRLQFNKPLQQAKRVLKSTSVIIQSVKHSGTARLTITRGSGPRGYAPPKCSEARWLLSLYAAPTIETSQPQHCIIAETRWSYQPQFAGIKLLSRTEQVLAAKEAEEAGVDDAIMLDHLGHAISSSRGNLFVVSNDKVITPALDHCGIAGTRRRLLIDRVFPRLSLRVATRPLILEELWESDEAMISNAVVGVIPIASIGDKTWFSHPVSEEALLLLKEETVVCSG